jgi:branched-chain amino acid transport system permease protein
MQILLQLIISGLVVGGIYGLAALGFVLVYKTSSVLNLAQGEFLALGALVCFFLAVQLGIPIALAIVLTLVICLLIGFLVDAVLMRPMIGQPLISKIMLTVGLMIFLNGLMQAVWGSDIHSYPPLLDGEIEIFPDITLNYISLFAIFIILILSIGFTLFFNRTKFGVVMRAIAEDQMGAQSLGLSVKRCISAAWQMACLTAGIGGILLGYLTGVSTAHLPSVGLAVFPVAVLGGLDSVGGALLAGLTIGVVENLAAGYLDEIIPNIKEIIPYVVVLIVLLFRPEGFFGSRRIERI